MKEEEVYTEDAADPGPLPEEKAEPEPEQRRSRRLVVPLPSHLADHLRQISGFTGETIQALLARVAGREELVAAVKNAGLAALAEADQRALAARKALEEL